MNKRPPKHGRGRFIAAHRQFIGVSQSWDMRATGRANKLAVGCDKSAPTVVLCGLRKGIDSNRIVVREEEV